MTAGPSTPPPQVLIPGTGWIDLASRVVVQVGFPVVVSAVLLWFVLGHVTARMETNTGIAQDMAETMVAQTEELKKHTVELQKQTLELQQQTAILRAIGERRRQPELP